MAERDAGAALHPRIEELLELLDETRAALTMTAASVRVNSRALRPAEGRWSLGEILDHVARVEASFTRLLNKRVADARTRGDERETDESSVLGRFNGEIVVDRAQRFAAPAIVLPQVEVSADAAMAALEASRAAVRAALVNASGVALGTLTHTHPVFGVLDMYQWAIVLAYHDLRHAAQIRELAQASTGG